MRHFYLDEAGIGNPLREPYTVVAGVVVHVDNQYESLRQYLLDMADDLVAPNSLRPANFYFHAKDLWHGSRFFPRSNWSLEKRLEILGHLADIPAKFDLPIIYSCVKRDEYAPTTLSKEQRAAADKKCHGSCFLSCLSMSDKWIGQYCPGEKVFAVVEMHRDHKSGLQLIADVFSDPRLKEKIQKDSDLHFDPFQHFVETPLFSPKSGTSPLQIADACALILSRSLGGANHSEPLLKKIEPQLVSGFRRKFFEKVSGEEQFS